MKAWCHICLNYTDCEVAGYTGTKTEPDPVFECCLCGVEIEKEDIERDEQDWDGLFPGFKLFND